MAITSRGYAGTINTEAYARLSRRFGGASSVIGPSSWELVADPAVDRGLRVRRGDDGGQLYGYGVLNTMDEDVVKAADPVTSGSSRWDTVVARHDWRPRPPEDTRDRTTIEVIPGGEQKAIAAGVLRPDPVTSDRGAGVRADVLIGLAQFTPESTVARDFVDLRLWRAEGGATARSDLVRSFYSDLGTRLTIAEPGARPVEHASVPTVDKAGKVAQQWVSRPLGSLDLFARSSRPIDNIAIPAGAAILEQTGYTEMTTSENGDVRISFPQEFPGGLISLDLTLVTGIGVFNPVPVFVTVWPASSGNPQSRPTRARFTARVWQPSGAPYPRGAFGFSYRAVGW